MPVFKVVINFISPGTGGGRWSEIYYRSKAALSDAATFTEAQLAARLCMLSNMNTLTKIRVSDVANPRVTTLVNVNRRGTEDDDLHEKAGNTGESAVLTLSSTVRPSSRKVWLRGTRGSVQYRDNTLGNWAIVPEFQTKVTAWIHQLALDGFSCVILTRKKTLADGVRPVVINTVQGLANGTSVVTVAQDALLIATDTLVISGVNDRALPGINGGYQILSIAGNAITIGYAVPGAPITITPTSGTLKKLAYFEDARINESISGWSYGGVRQTKNEFTGSRGAYRRGRTRRVH